MSKGQAADRPIRTGVGFRRWEDAETGTDSGEFEGGSLRDAKL